MIGLSTGIKNAAGVLNGREREMQMEDTGGAGGGRYMH